MELTELLRDCRSVILAQKGGRILKYCIETAFKLPETTTDDVTVRRSEVREVLYNEGLPFDRIDMIPADLYVNGNGTIHLRTLKSIADRVKHDNGRFISNVKAFKSYNTSVKAFMNETRTETEYGISKDEEILRLCLKGYSRVKMSRIVGVPLKQVKKNYKSITSGLNALLSNDDFKAVIENTFGVAELKRIIYEHTYPLHPRTYRKFFNKIIPGIENVLYSLDGYREAELNNDRPSQIRILKELFQRRDLFIFFKEHAGCNLDYDFTDPHGLNAPMLRMSPTSLVHFYSNVKKLDLFSPEYPDHLVLCSPDHSRKWSLGIFSFDMFCKMMDDEFIPRHYMVKADASYPGISISSPVHALFHDSFPEANSYYLGRWLSLEERKIRMISLLADITGNDSTLLPSVAERGAGKVMAHLYILDGVMRNTVMTERESLTLEMLLDGKNVKDIVGELAEHYKNFSNKYDGVVDVFTMIKSKILMQAIKMYPQLESGADLGDIKKQYDKDGRITFDRFARFRLQIAIDEKIQQEGITRQEFYKDLLNGIPGYLSHAITVFNNSKEDLINFIYGDMIHDDRMARAKRIEHFRTSEGRFEVYENIEQILAKENKVHLTTKMVKDYGLHDMILGLVGEKPSTNEAEEKYLTEYIGTRKFQLPGKDGKIVKRHMKKAELNEFRKNRKLVYMLFESGNACQRPDAALDILAVKNIDRAAVYQAAGVSQQIIDQLEYRLGKHAYPLKGHESEIEETADHFGLTSSQVRHKFEDAKKRLADAFNSVYK